MTPSDPRADRTALGCGTLFLLPFALGAIVAAGLIGREMWFSAVALAWVETQCAIDRVELKEKVTADGDMTYRNLADYRYDFEGQTYRNNQVDFEWGFDNFSDRHQAVHAELSARAAQARPVRCFINPRNPKEAVLYRDLHLSKVFFGLIFAGAFGLIGIGGLRLLFRSTRTRLR